jgi:hypothetical protein
MHYLADIRRNNVLALLDGMAVKLADKPAELAKVDAARAKVNGKNEAFWMCGSTEASMATLRKIVAEA